ncbi:sialidase family protein [Aestuariibaculum sediminum]|uniref:Exo-alpha-sialidase n=1 Tax=Aestuariibaculum sediminum TaxID=2770637 RepID=A0A8J6Q8G8_9FLAO|nr:sialidase family protein [Aestuariibaculum sediminum]MBD0832715.1 exo-alpha-sialidase [Aestuariibaculum sediminum]
MNKNIIILFSCIYLSGICWGQTPTFKVLKEEFLFTENTYFKQCHASTIEEAKNGNLLISWFGGTHEGSKDVVIWGIQSKGKSWTTPKIWADGIKDTLQFPCWNPVLFRAKKEKTIYLYYKVGPNPREWWGMVKSSKDNGNTWSKPENLAKGILGPIKNKPIELSNGTIISPSSIEINENTWKAHVEISEDQQETWKSYPIDYESKYNVIQPSILKHKNGTLQVLCRSKEGVVATAWSKNSGKNWTSLEPTNLANPNSGTDAIAIDNFFIIAYNPDLPGKEWWEGRSKLRLAYSYDGLDWTDLLILEDHEEGEFSYPTLFMDSKGLIHITYTYNRKNIKHWVLRF